MIGRITNQMMAQSTLTNIESSLDQVDTTQQELSSGKKINQPSDDPYGTSLSMKINGDLAQLNSYNNNVSDGTAWTQAASTSLSNMNDIVQRVQELTTEAANGSNTTSNDQAAAAEVNQLIDSLKGEANSQYNGQYIFSGTSTQTAPYQTGSGSSDTFQGGTGAITRAIGPSTTVQVNVNISSVLGSGQSANSGSGDGGLIDTLQQIASDMQSGNTAGLNTDLTTLQGNANSLSQLSSQVGAVTDQLTMASSRISSLQDNDSTVLSNTQDADIATTEIAFSTQQAALQAALQSSAQILQTSLMSFLSNG